jgi:hypothetical protein
VGNFEEFSRLFYNVRLIASLNVVVFGFVNNFVGFSLRLGSESGILDNEIVLNIDDNLDLSNNVVEDIEVILGIPSVSALLELGKLRANTVENSLDVGAREGEELRGDCSGLLGLSKSSDGLIEIFVLSELVIEVINQIGKRGVDLSVKNIVLGFSLISVIENELSLCVDSGEILNNEDSGGEIKGIRCRDLGVGTDELSEVEGCGRNEVGELLAGVDSEGLSQAEAQN